jgi:hypothetical protein
MYPFNNELLNESSHSQMYPIIVKQSRQIGISLNTRKDSDCVIFKQFKHLKLYIDIYPVILIHFHKDIQILQQNIFLPRLFL